MNFKSFPVWARGIILGEIIAVISVVWMLPIVLFEDILLPMPVVIIIIFFFWVISGVLELFGFGHFTESGGGFISFPGPTYQGWGIFFLLCILAGVLFCVIYDNILRNSRKPKVYIGSNEDQLNNNGSNKINVFSIIIFLFLVFQFTNAFIHEAQIWNPFDKPETREVQIQNESDSYNNGSDPGTFFYRTDDLNIRLNSDPEKEKSTSPLLHELIDDFKPI